MTHSPSSARPGQRRQRQEQAQRQRRRRLLRVWLPAGILVIILVAYAIYQTTRPDLPGVVDLGAQLRGHDSAISYEGQSLPPAGGKHGFAWQNCGIYDTPIDTANAVHSLEHGAVWLAYNPDLPAPQVTALQDQIVGESYVLMSPYPGLQGRIVLTAWGKRLVLDGVDARRIKAFIDRYRGGGPEPGALCNGSVGSPVR
ncbi:MAG: DUF3105 domain-containing protein [Anaerolineales bacterium]|nr:DUF3105 domain-containing protein [Anaerolineales bacterium]MCB8950792.1 DUF3105 domain-containing protein [Ardenticatenales bacterium]